MVTGEPPHKRIADDPGAEVRLRLAELAADREEGVRASDLEVRCEGPSYTYLTLEHLGTEFAGRELVLLLGADMAATLENWMRPERVVELARLGIAARPGAEIDAALAALEHLDAADRGEIIEMPECALSSTIVRQRVAAGRPLRHLVPDRVLEEIERRGLYR